MIRPVYCSVQLETLHVVFCNYSFINKLSYGLAWEVMI